jgi:O-antigen/teichoic acid export membrane protein
MERFDRRTLERVYLSMGLGVAITIPFAVLIFAIGRPILTELGIGSPCAARFWAG